MKTISDHVLDIVQNSVAAKATLIEIVVTEDEPKDFYELDFKDNGCGMNEATLQQAANPFFTTRNTRRVGLGIPLLKHNATVANGKFEICSEEGKGTRVKAKFQLSHIDRPPVGDIWDSLYLIIVSNPEIRIIYNHRTPDGTFGLDSDRLMQILDGVPLKHGEIKRAVIDLVKNNLEEINASK